MSSAFSDRIIQSLLDTDFYKLTMMQAVLHHYPNAEVEWAFRSRSGEDLSPYLSEIRHQIEALAELQMSAEELAFLEARPLYAARLHPLSRAVPLRSPLPAGGRRGRRAGDVPARALAACDPVRSTAAGHRQRGAQPRALCAGDAGTGGRQAGRKFAWLRSQATAEELASFTLADFGTRRRFSFAVQAMVVERLRCDFPGRFVGTSNVHLARTLDVKPMGTMAHEWIMAHQQLGLRLIDSQVAALDCWVREYRGALGIALTDCITMDAFLRDFDLYFAKLFDGLRHDSGEPWNGRRKPSHTTSASASIRKAVS